MRQDQTHLHISKKIDLEIDWRGLIAGLGILLFFSIFGPAPLLLALLLRRWGSSSIWRAPDRWDSIRAMALAFPLLYLPTYIFWNKLSLWWASLPHILGAWSIMPPAFDSIAAHALLTLPLVPALALLLERGQAHTLPVEHVIRRPRSDEVLAPPQLAPLIAAPQKPEESPKAKPQEQRAAATQPALLEASLAPKPKRSSTRKTRDPRPPGEVLAEDASRQRNPPPILPPHRDQPPPIDWSQVKE